MSACLPLVLVVALVAVSSLHAEPEVRRAIPVERSKSPRSTPVRKALPVASPTPAIPAATVVATATPDSNPSQFVSIPLLKELTIEVPGFWWILGGEFDALIKTTVEATLKLTNISTPEGQRTSLFRANSMPRSTYAGVSVSVTNPPDFTPAEYHAAGESELRELAQYIADLSKQTDVVLIAPPVATKETLNGIPAIVVNYTKQGKKGPTRVELIELFTGGKQFSITLAYRESESVLWKPVIAHMRRSIARTGAAPVSNPASDQAANSTPVPDTARDTINIADHFTIEIGKDWVRDVTKKKQDEFHSLLLSASCDEPYVLLEVSATTNLFKSDTILEHNIKLQQGMLERVKADWQRQLDVPIVESSVRVVAINGIRTLVIDIVGERKITLRSIALFFDDGKTFAVFLLSAGDHASSETAKVTNSITPNIKLGPQKALAATLDRKSPDMPVQDLTPTPVPTPERTPAPRSASTQVVRELKYVARTGFDPIKPVFPEGKFAGTVERGIYGLVGSHGFMSATAGNPMPKAYNNESRIPLSVVISGGLIFLVIWSIITLTFGWIIISIFPKGIMAWLRLVLLFTLLFIGHVLQIALHIQGLPGIPGLVLFPFIIPALIEEYRTANVFTDHPDANWPTIVSIVHGLLIYGYLAANVYAFRLMKRKTDSAAASLPPKQIHT